MKALKKSCDIPIDFSLCKEVFEKFGERRLISRGEYFARSGEMMEYAGWIVSGGFKYSLMSSDGNNRVFGFSLDDSLLIGYESVMHSYLNISRRQLHRIRERLLRPLPNLPKDEIIYLSLYFTSFGTIFRIFLCSFNLLCVIL